MPCYHVACDDVDNVDLERVAIFTDATFAVTNALGRGSLRRSRPRCGGRRSRYAWLSSRSTRG